MFSERVVSKSRAGGSIPRFVNGRRPDCYFGRASLSLKEKVIRSNRISRSNFPIDVIPTICYSSCMNRRALYLSLLRSSRYWSSRLSSSCENL